MKVENAVYPTADGIQALARDTSSAKIAGLEGQLLIMTESL